MYRARRALGAALSTTLATAVVASGAGLTAPASAAPSPATTSTSDRSVTGLLDLVADALSGSGLVGSPLTLLSNPFIDSLVTVTRVEWLRDGVVIPGADGSSYTPEVGDVGHQIRARVSGLLILVPVQGLTQSILVQDTDTGGEPADELVAHVPPQITGIPGVGSLLQVVDPVWNLLGVLTTYQWLSDGVPIPGADDKTFIPTLDQAGTVLTVKVTGLLGSLPLVDIITAGVLVPEPDLTAAPPAVSGPGKIGETLTVSDPEWNVEGVENSYAWLRDGSPIDGATARSYQLVPADLGRAITAKVTGTRGDSQTDVTSAAVVPTAGDAIKPTRAPRVTGTPALGQALTATPGTWGTGETPAFGYQWLRDGGPITGATQASYVVTLADLGRDLSLRVTATRTAYAPGSFTTAGLPVARVATSTTAKAARKKIRQGRAAVLRITVDAGAASPDGKVRIDEGTKRLRTFKVANGTKKVRVTGLGRGKHVLRVGYLGSATTEASKVRKVVVRVLGRKRR